MIFPLSAKRRLELQFRRWRAESASSTGPLQLFPTPASVAIFFIFQLLWFCLAGVGAVVRVDCVSLRREYTPWTRNRPAGRLRLEASSGKVYLLFRGWKNVII